MNVQIIAAVAVAFVLLTFIATFFFYIGLWIRLLVSGNPLPLFRLIEMKLRHVPPGKLVDTFIRARKADVAVTLDQLEGHFMAGGHPSRVVEMLIKARHRDIDVPFEVVAKTDLAGYNLDTMAPDKFRTWNANTPSQGMPRPTRQP